MTSAFVFVNCATNRRVLVQERVKQVQGVEYAKLTIGVYDLIVEVRGDNHETLMRVIDHVKLVDGVRFALTTIIQDPRDTLNSSGLMQGEVAGATAPPKK